MEALNPYVIDGKARARLAELRGGTLEENATRHRIAGEAEHGLLGAEALAALEQIHARHVPPTVHLAAQGRTSGPVAARRDAPSRGRPGVSGIALNAPR
jgi:hypothetical protein